MPLATSATGTLLAPGSTSTRAPASSAAPTTTAPGSLTTGIPASLHTATTSPARTRATSPGARAASLCSCRATSSAARIPCRSSRTRVRRVSSQATTSASRSTSSTRSVTSSRLPIGVGQTTRRPAPPQRPRAASPSKASAAAPSIPDSAPNRAGRMRTASRGTGSARSATTSRAGLEQQVARRDRAAADDDDLGVEDVDEAREADAEAAPHRGDEAAGHLVPVMGHLGHERPRHRRPAGQRPPERRARVLLGDAPALAPERRARDERLQAPAAGAGPGARRPVGLDDDVAELGRRPHRAADDRPVDEQPAADARCRGSGGPRRGRPVPPPSATRPGGRRCRRCRRTPAGRCARRARRRRGRPAAGGGSTSGRRRCAGR